MPHHSNNKADKLKKFISSIFKTQNHSENLFETLQTPGIEWIKLENLIREDLNAEFTAFKMSLPNPSQIITSEELLEIIKNLDYSLSEIKIPVPLFSTNKHGFSLSSLYKQTEKVNDSILLIETMKDEIFGAYVTDCWTLKNRSNINHFYGRGKSFVFKIRPKPVEIYRWVPDKIIPEMFQRATTECLEIGGGGKGPAIYIDKYLNNGNSSASATFHNPSLTVYSNHGFQIRSLELLAFEDYNH